MLSGADVIMAILDAVGFRAVRPEGSYYTMADYTGIAAPQAEVALRPLRPLA